jgi:thiamine biosynthesis lipoprotein
MGTKKKKVTRRKFLHVCAMASAYAAVPWSSALAEGLPLNHWRGILLGTEVKLTIAHNNPDTAKTIFKSCVEEIKRLENIFTLYDSHSEISRLNQKGALENPSTEFIDILEQSRLYYSMTNSAFDITVKSLEDGHKASPIGIDHIDIQKHKISFKQDGMAITLNGIAQGYITDHIADKLKRDGLTNALVELGEKRAIGPHPSNRPWLIRVQGQEEPVQLNDTAFSTSALYSPNTGKKHIYNPSEKIHAGKHTVVSVHAKRATMADALSTGFMSLSEEEIRGIQSQHPDEIINVYLS